MNFTLSLDANDARLAGLAAWLDSGPDNAFIYLFANDQPVVPGDSAGGSPVAQITLAKPCGSVIAHELVFEQLDAGADQIVTQGGVKWARLYTAAGVWAADGDASDMDGNVTEPDGSLTPVVGGGAFKISGTTGTLFYAGALAILGELKMV